MVKPRLDPQRVSQLDATTLQIELPQLARYAISEPETISFAAPGAAMRTVSPNPNPNRTVSPNPNP